METKALITKSYDGDRDGDFRGRIRDFITDAVNTLCERIYNGIDNGYVNGKRPVYSDTLTIRVSARDSGGEAISPAIVVTDIRETPSIGIYGIRSVDTDAGEGYYVKYAGYDIPEYETYYLSRNVAIENITTYLRGRGIEKDYNVAKEIATSIVDTTNSSR